VGQVQVAAHHSRLQAGFINKEVAWLACRGLSQNKYEHRISASLLAALTPLPLFWQQASAVSPALQARTGLCRWLRRHGS